MSISGISSHFLSAYQNQYPLGAKSNALQQDFQQLGQALQSGKPSAAQSGPAALDAVFSNPASATSTTPSATASPVKQDFNQLASDIQAGNFSAAQKDYATVQQDIQNRGTLAPNDFHHRHHLGGSTGSGDASQSNPLLQDLTQVGQSLTSGSLAGAQQAYATLQQELQKFTLGSGVVNSQGSTLPAQSPVSLQV